MSLAKGGHAALGQCLLEAVGVLGLLAPALGLCPLMFGAASDGGHRFMCRLLTWTGKVPRTV